MLRIVENFNTLKSVNNKNGHLPASPDYSYN